MAFLLLDTRESILPYRPIELDHPRREQAHQLFAPRDERCLGIRADVPLSPKHVEPAHRFRRRATRDRQVIPVRARAVSAVPLGDVAPVALADRMIWRAKTSASRSFG